MRAVDWSSVSPIAGSRWLPCDFVGGLVSGLLNPGQARVVVIGRDTYTGLPAIPSVPLLRDLPAWSQVREEAARYFHHVHNIALPDSFPNTPVHHDSTPPTGAARSGSSDLDPLSSSPRGQVP